MDAIIIAIFLFASTVNRYYDLLPPEWAFCFGKKNTHLPQSSTHTTRRTNNALPNSQDLQRVKNVGDSRGLCPKAVTAVPCSRRAKPYLPSSYCAMCAWVNYSIRRNGALWKLIFRCILRTTRHSVDSTQELNEDRNGLFHNNCCAFLNSLIQLEYLHQMSQFLGVNDGWYYCWTIQRVFFNLTSVQVACYAGSFIFSADQR